MSMKRVELLELNLKQSNLLFQLSRDIASKFTGDEELGKFAQDIFRTKTSEVFKVNLLGIAETLEYTGFSPEAVLKEFWSMGKLITMDKTWTIYADEDTQTTPLITINSKDVHQHIILHILFFVMRGTSTKKALKKMQKQWVEPLTFIFKTYKTASSDKGKGRELTRGTPTIARLCSCYPQIVCYFLSKGIGKTYVDSSIIEKLAGCQVPRIVLTNMFVGLVPQSVQGDELMKLARIYHFMLDIKLQSSAKQPKMLETIKSEILTYTNAARNSTFLSKEMREFFLDIFGVTKNGALTAEMMDICKACGDLWEHLLLSRNLDEFSQRLNSITLKEDIREYPKVEEINSLHAYFGEDTCAMIIGLISGVNMPGDASVDFEGVINLAAGVNSITAAEQNLGEITFGQGVVFLIALGNYLKRESYAYLLNHLFGNGRGLQTVYAASIGSIFVYGNKELAERRECTLQEMKNLSTDLTGCEYLFTDDDSEKLPLNSRRPFYYQGLIDMVAVED